MIAVNGYNEHPPTHIYENTFYCRIMHRYKVIISPDVIGPGVITGQDGHWNGCMGQVERKVNNK